MLDSVLGFGVLGFLGTMAWLGIRQLQRDQYRREAEYWQHECAMLEYENRFLHGLEQRLIPRLLNRFGADMQDFMIDRELVRHNETAHPKQAGHITVQMYDPSRASKGIDITAGNFVGKDGADEADEWDSETEYADCCPTDVHRQPFEQRSNTTIAQRGYPSNRDAKPQAPIRSNRAGGIPQIGWQGNDIIDADFVEIPSGHIRQADNSLLQDSTQPHTRKGGRPKKYATAAERQAAYRARRAA